MASYWILRTATGGALGDLDGDGDLDFFSANYGGSSEVWLNDGSGNFTLLDTLAVAGNCAEGVTLGDLDGDGDLDAVVAFYNSSSVVWINQINEGGSESFVDVGLRLSDNEARTVALGDVDGDGDLDVVVPREYSPNELWINDLDTTGVFTKVQDVGDSAITVALGDLNEDGWLDLFVGHWGSGHEIWLNDGSGRFNSANSTLNESEAWVSKMADLNGDGHLDVVVSGNGGLVYLGYGDGTLASPLVLETGFTTLPSIGDTNGDGKLDVLWLSTTGDLYQWRGDGAGGFTNANSGLGQEFTSNFNLGDLDGDGDLDVLATSGGDNQVWLNEFARVVDADSLTPTVEVFVGAAINVFEDAGDLVVNINGDEWFRSLLQDVDGLTLIGSTQTDSFEIDVDGLTTGALPQGINVVAGEGQGDRDELVLVGEQTYGASSVIVEGESGSVTVENLDIMFSEIDQHTIVDNLIVDFRSFRVAGPNGQTIELETDPTNPGRIRINDGGSGDFITILVAIPNQLLEVNAGEGNDTVIVKSLPTTFVAQVNGEEGDDSIDASAAVAPIVITGGTGDDNLVGGGADDRIDGGEGNDQIDGGEGSDQIDGGPGINQISASFGDAAIVNEGDLFRISATLPGTITAVVDWGDSQSESAVIDTASGRITASHTYADDGAYLVFVTLTDSDGNVYTQAIDVSVANVAPTPAIVTISDTRRKGRRLASRARPAIRPAATTR